MSIDPGGRWASAGTRARLIVVGVLVVVLAAVGVGLTHSAIFSARTITISGASHLSDATVLRRADVRMGTNLFYLDTAAVRARLLADPWVAEATVRTHLPSEIEIVIREVRPVAVSADVEAPELLAPDGSALGAATSEARLPTVAGTQGSIRTATTVLAAISPSFLDRIDHVAVDPQGRIVLTLRNSVVVTFGDAGEAERKGQALRAVLAWATAQPIAVVSIDVSSPAVPTAHLRGTTAATAVALPSSEPSPSATPSP